MWGMIAGAVLQGVMASNSAAQQGVNESRRIKAQNRARIAQMQNQWLLNTENLHNNNISIRQNKLKNDFAIEENKLDAEDAFTQSFIGSGIKGRTYDAMAADLQGDVDKAHNAARDIATQETVRQFLGLMRSADANKFNINNLSTFDSSANSANIAMAGMSAAVGSLASSAVQGGFDGAFDGFGDSSGVKQPTGFRKNAGAFRNARNKALR